MHGVSLWRRSPPAIFPVCLGFLGLGLGWRSAGQFVPFATEIGGLILGAATTYFLFFLATYLRKLIARPSVLWDEMAIPASRAGIAACAMSMMLLAAAFLPFGISAPHIWWTGVVMQIGASVIVCYAILKDPPNERHFTPFQYLTFVGPVAGPIAGIPLGHVVESIMLTFAALIAHLVITAGLAWQLTQRLPSPAMRPALAIFLAPNCLFALSFGALGYEWGFALFYWVANVTAFLLILLVPWMIRAGWSPAWAAFTFPGAAWLNVQSMAVEKGAGLPAIIGVYAGLIIATPLILFIAYRFAMMWVTGVLAEKTGAATV